MEKILILNQGHTENYGDVAINNVISGYFKREGYEITVYPFWDEKQAFGEHFYKAPYFIQRFLLNKLTRIDFFNTISIRKVLETNYDAVIIGGGELLGNHIGFNSSLFVWSRELKRRNIPLFIIGVSGDSKMSDEMLERNAIALSNVRKVFVRDITTAEVCRSIYNINCDYYPDVVFALHDVLKKPTHIVEERRGIVIIPILYFDLFRENMGINSENEYFLYLKSKINTYKRDNEPVTICVSTKEDYTIAKKFYEFLDTDSNIEIMPYETLDIFEGILSSSRYVISARMHAMILGLINGCKVSSIPFKGKLSEFMNNYDDKEVDVSGLSALVLISLNEINMEIKGVSKNGNN